jgi:hypothetical protein
MKRTNGSPLQKRLTKVLDRVDVSLLCLVQSDLVCTSSEELRGSVFLGTAPLNAEPKGKEG